MPPMPICTVGITGIACSDISPYKNGCRFRDPLSALLNDVAGKMREWKINLVLFRSASASFQKSKIHTTRHYVERREIFYCWCVELYEILGFTVEKVAAFATGALGNTNLEYQITVTSRRVMGRRRHGSAL